MYFNFLLIVEAEGPLLMSVYFCIVHYHFCIKQYLNVIVLGKLPYLYKVGLYVNDYIVFIVSLK